MSHEAFPPEFRLVWTAKLSKREREVARLLACGLSQAEIAAELCRSPHTIRAQIRHAGSLFPGSGTPSVRLIRAYAVANGAAT
ncbi:MAG: helix-turn-helix transcriptional regulator [Gemmatimonadota bacterium]